MPEYGITDKGFVLKRLDTILEEIHSELSEGFGIDTRLTKPSFLDVLVTTFGGQIADLWETAQDSYYAKYPATATGLNLDNAVQYGGIRREASKQTAYPLHCTGDDGTNVPSGTAVATNTKPEIKLHAETDFQITRGNCNSLEVITAVAGEGVYTIAINGDQYSYTSEGDDASAIIAGLKEAVRNAEYDVTVGEGNVLQIADTVKDRNDVVVLSDNLTTKSVTTIARFLTDEYGKVALPNRIITRIINNVAGLKSVINLLAPVYGRLAETDVELRQSYIAKSAIRSNTMLDSIVAELLNNVADVESAAGYENYEDYTDARGLPPHSIEIIVEGGDNMDIARAILNRKAGGIQTFGSITVDVQGNYGDVIPIHFNRPDYLYTWLKVTLHGKESEMPDNYVDLTKESLLEDAAQFHAGVNLLLQLLTDGIYGRVSGITYIDIYTFSTTDKGKVPTPEEYKHENIIVTDRQKILIGETRIEVALGDEV